MPRRPTPPPGLRGFFYPQPFVAEKEPSCASAQCMR